MNKPWVTTEVYNNAEQKLLIQPTPEFSGLEIYIQETTETHSSAAFYIDKDELPTIIEKLTEMMNYITK
jgi:hypothetical protein